MLYRNKVINGGGLVESDKDHMLSNDTQRKIVSCSSFICHVVMCKLYSFQQVLISTSPVMG